MNNFYYNDEDDTYNLEINSDNSDQLSTDSKIRFNTAPARPLTEIEAFKRSNLFYLIEQSILCQQQLISYGHKKYDLDSQDGQKNCRKFLQLLQKLIESFQAYQSPKEYRQQFSKAYQVLYNDGQNNYLTEILDAAQEGFSYLYVNGSKYVFSQEVLIKGQNLMFQFEKVQAVLKQSFQKLCQLGDSVSIQYVKTDISFQLEELDLSWCKFEQQYVTELMLIEKDARNIIQKAIDIEKELQSIEIREKLKGHILVNNQDYEFLRNQLTKLIGQINSVANFEGKGRDDLCFEILLKAESIINRVSQEESKAIRFIAQKIRNSFISIRKLLREYEQNIEMVDPQLKNNQDLVEILVEYESAWEKGKNYFLQKNRCIHLIHFSHIIEATAEKHIEFQESLELRDSEIFLQIPCLLILKNLENEDKNICQHFFQNIYESEIHKDLQKLFDDWKMKYLKNYEYYNILENYILNISQNSENLQTKVIEQIIHKIKQLAMEMERKDPTEWNCFLEAALQQ